ncbi:RDD family protein [Streptomyces tropicalis]|uniref:RDD family protein n=1 Tax=Streptomyces tropicalis TaxID=3034234 RepID=A0ABT6A022_9ACTN|nr:RDD family protein [Streptomyces tropicalis]MDF3297741.1 RDD family protein [Streptomyces tropicalis]
MSSEPPSGSGPQPPPPGEGPNDGGSSGGGPYWGPPPSGDRPGEGRPGEPGSGQPGPGQPGQPGAGQPGPGQPGGPPPGGPYGGGPYGGGPYGGGPPGGGGPYGGGSYGGRQYPPDPLAGMPPLADSGRRTLARIIDLILVGIVVWLLTWGLRVNETMVNADHFQFGKSFAQSVIGVVLYIAYDTFLISRSGQTLGKKWLGMRVANLADGSTPSVQTALGRAAVLWLPFWFCCACVWLAVAGGWSYFDRPYKQGLHDKAAKTVVVSTG